jgi:hypothetical protein
MLDETTQEIESDNPWIQHRKGLTGKLLTPGILLPKRIVRPFWTPTTVSIDNKRVVIEGMGKRDFLSLLSGLSLVIGGSVLLVWFLANTGFTTDFYIALVFLALSLIFYLGYKRTPASWYKIFDRETGYFETSRGLPRKRFRVRFSDCEGRLSSGATYVGSINYGLHLSCPGTGGFHLMELSASSTDLLLGYWSFLVQYMDKSKPLPDVKGLSNYPNREPGLGSWQEWEEREKQIDFVDPYIEWLRELERNPNLDLANIGKSKATHYAAIYMILAVFFISISCLFYLIYYLNH